MTFEALGLAEPILRAVSAEGYTVPTPIQQAAIPTVLTGRDLIGIAQTGTGKTAAFALPILHRLAAEDKPRRPNRPRALVIVPTRELAIQVHENFRAYAKFLTLRGTVVFGGVGQNPQERALRGGVDVLTATPGRLLDLYNQGHVRFDDVSVFVLDEADRMLDYGFLPDVRRIVATLPKERQTLMFSATLPSEIVALTAQNTRNPARVEATPPATTVELIDQKVIFVPTADKRRVVTQLVGSKQVTRALVFIRTKHQANRLAQYLVEAGVPALAIHGNKSQSARQNALGRFKTGETPVLVATDIAARGIDVDGISHVINFDLPNVAESYVHRIGRTARAGASGVALSLVDRSEIGDLRSIERLIGRRIEVMDEPGQPSRPSHSERAVPGRG